MAADTPNQFNSPRRSGEDRICEALRRIGFALRLPIDRSDLDLGDISIATAGSQNSEFLIAAARHVGVLVKPAVLEAGDVHSVLSVGFPVILTQVDGSIWVCERLAGKRIEGTCVRDTTEPVNLSKRQLRELLMREGVQTFVAKKELECQSASVAGSGAHLNAELHGEHSGQHRRHHGEHHEHPAPLSRFIALLSLDSRDVWTIMLFGGVAGILSLATPLAIESLVNVVSWGTYLQPLLVLSLMLFVCLGMAGVLSILQSFVVEVVQRRQFVRLIGDLAHRFPRANQDALSAQYPRELANRFFDIMTIQKSTASLLLDGINLVLTTLMGLILLGFYHPFLLGFDIVLVFTMISVTLLLGRGGIRTSIAESIVKYRVAHWLQDVISMPTAFKVNGGEFMAIERANRLTVEYITAREQHFRIVIRQAIFAIGLQVVASTALLGLGGWLVMQQQLTLGQLVASELIVTVVVGAFAKAGKSIEQFYDLMAGVDKVGHLLDVEVDPRYELGSVPGGPTEVRWDQLTFHFETTGTHCNIPGTTIAPGQRVAITGDDRSGKSLLLKTLAGLVHPHHGMVEIAGLEAMRAALGGEGKIVGYAGRPEIFCGTLQENIDLGRKDIGQNRVREVLSQVGLWDIILALPDGLRTVLQTDGSPLSRTQRTQLAIARAMAGGPRLLLIDGLLDDLTIEVQEPLWKALNAPENPWTLLVATNHRDIAKYCGQQVELAQHHG